MKSNSDESDYEDESFNQDNEESVEEREMYNPFFSDRSSVEGQDKRKDHSTLTDEASDVNSSDCNEDYFDEKADEKFKSHKMYQDLSCEQDSADEESFYSIQGDPMDNLPNCSNEVVQESRKKRSMYEDSYQPSKRRKVQKTKDKSHEDFVMQRLIEDNKDYDTREVLNKQESKGVFDGQDKVQRMMQKMGYKEGHGLGKNKQGRLEPVQAAKQHGRRGLGHHIPGLEASSLKWDPVEEEIKVIEDIQWIRSLDKSLDVPTLEEMQHWLQKGPRKLTIDDETHFCHEDILKNVINAKTVFDKLDDVELRRARTRSNPYETILGAFFLNRAAVKMANIDKACNFMFTDPKCLENNELLYFADVCAGPGGFSEYVLWRKKWHAKGFGLTLKNENDFKLGDFYAGPCETFHPYYGPKNDGDVFDPSNQEGFRNLIMEHTNGKGVHFMMSDGGFSVEGQENIQEILSKQLYLCQCLIALMIVREKGHFVTKLFDLFTPFSAGLIYLMYRCFEEICIFKPNSSRPANSERYLVCKSKRSGIEDVVEHLKRVNHLLLKGDKNNDVLQLVSFEELEQEKQFVQYLCTSNDSLGKKQIIGLRKIAAFCEDTTLVETKQAEMRTECLKYWNLPDESRTIPRCMKPRDKLHQLLNDTTFLSSTPKKLTVDNIGNTIMKQPYDWFCVPCGTGPIDEPNDEKKDATFYMGMGRSNVYRYVKGTWVQVNDITIELPPNTLVYAEVVYEMIKEFRNQRRVLGLHIIDALYLGGENISQKYIGERHELIKKFCKALWKPAGSNYARIRAKELLPVCANICERLQVKKRTMKNNQTALVYELSETSLDCNNSDNEKPYFVLNSVIFLRSTASPWNRYLSNTYFVTYVFNYKTADKAFDSDRPAEAEANFINSFKERFIWYWPKDESLTMEIFKGHIRTKCPAINRTLKY